MSYILNALRKSDQARRALHPELALSVSPPAGAVKSSVKVTVILTVIGVINLVALVYLLATLQKKTALETEVLTLPAPSALPISVVPEETVRVPKVDVKPVTGGGDAISALWAKKQKSLQVDVAAPAAIKLKQPVKKQVLANLKAIANEKDPKAVKGAVTIERLDPFDAEGTLPFPDKKRIPQNTVPLLRELSSDFQAKVPPLTINVLAYAGNSNDRFVIIDMVKYKIGQRIKQAVTLLDILPGSLLLRLEGQAFRIERP